MLVLGICTGLIAGSYPALYLSGFQPAKVLKRMANFSGRGVKFRRILVTVQFVIAIFLIIGVIGCFRQISYVVSRPLGYEPSNLVDISADGKLREAFEVLGATDGGLWLALSREFLQPVLIAFIVATPLGIFALQKLLATMDYRIPLSWWIFATAGGAAFVIALATVSYHGIRAARVNPALALASE